MSGALCFKSHRLSGVTKRCSIFWWLYVDLFIEIMIVICNHNVMLPNIHPKLEAGPIANPIESILAKATEIPNS